MHYEDFDDGYQNEAQRECAAIECGWASYPDKKDCACRGYGWILSDWDTWHRCPIHYRGQEDPYAQEVRERAEDWWDSLSGKEKHQEVVFMVRRRKENAAHEVARLEEQNEDTIPF